MRERKRERKTLSDVETLWSNRWAMKTSGSAVSGGGASHQRTDVFLLFFQHYQYLECWGVLPLLVLLVVVGGDVINSAPVIKRGCVRFSHE